MNVFPPFSMGVVELLMVAFLGTGVGVPLGVPPQDPDPMMAKMAPEKCLYYTTWAGMAQPDPNSPNQTEQLLSEAEVQVFVKEVDRVVLAVLERMAGQAPNQEMAVISANAPLLVKTLITHPTALFVESIASGPPNLDVKGALVVKLGPDLQQVRDALNQISEIVPEELAQRVKVEGIECLRFRPDPSVGPFTIGYKQDYLIVAAGEKSFEGVLARAMTPPPKWLTDGVAALKVPRPSTFAYADVASILQLVSALSGPDVARMLDTLGLTSIGTAISVSGLDETGFVSRTKFYSSDPDKGLGALVSAQPLQPKDLSGIPGDASLALITRFDLKQALGKGLELLGEVEPRAAEEIRQGLRQTEQALGISIQEDLLASLGDVWTLHTAPSSGGLLAGWTLTVSLQDAQKASETHEKLLKFARNVMQRGGPGFNRGLSGPSIKSFQCSGETAYVFDVPDTDFFVSPSWCLTDTHLVVTLLPQTLKSYVARDKHPGSLADQPVLARLLSGEQGPCSVSYQDTRRHFITFYPLVQIAAQMFAKQMQRENLDIDVSALPSITSVAPHLLPAVSAARKTDDGFESITHTTLPGANLGASAPVIVAMALPAIQSARQASQRTRSMNNMKMIGLAMHNYHDTHRAFPAAYNVDADGKPLLSWRVHILPYVEAQELYEQFHLDEPWNSEHNRKLIAQMPQLYKSPNSSADPGKTVYLGNAGKQGIIVAPKGDRQQQQTPTGTGMQEITDGTSNTIMVVETSDPAAVIWTKPDDLQFNEDNPLQGLRGTRPGGFLAGLCDGSVRLISNSVDPGILKGLFTRNGGEVIGEF